MTAKYFKYAFGLTGDRAAVPNATQVDGSVSYQQGYSFDYQRPKTDPLVKNIERDKMNELFYDLTGGLKQYQENAFPDYITAADNDGVVYPYPNGAYVRYTDGFVYKSLVAANVADPTDATKWEKVWINGLGVQTAGGTANALTLTALGNPAVTALTQIKPFITCRAAAANSGAATLQVNGLVAKPIVKRGTTALIAGDIAAAGAYLMLSYDSVADSFVLMNPANNVVETAAQFDNSTLTASTAFVQRQVGNLAGLVDLSSVANAVTAAMAGKIIWCDVAETNTLPLASSVPVGTVFRFFLWSVPGGITFARTGADIFYCGDAAGAGIAGSITPKNNGFLDFVAIGAGTWSVYGSAGIELTSGFVNSVAANGYQKLPSGVLVQWGSVVTSAGGTATITYPLAFPAAVYSGQLSVFDATTNYAASFTSDITASTTASTIKLSVAIAKTVYWHIVGK